MRFFQTVALVLYPSMVLAAPLDLLRLYDEMLRSNPRLEGRALEIDRASAQEDVAFSKLLPQVQASGTLSWNRLNQTVVNPFTEAESVNQFEYQGTRALVQASQALIDLPAYHQFKSRQSSLQQAGADLTVLQMSLASELVEHYLGVLQATDELAAVRAEQELTDVDLARVRKMASMQLVMQQDVYEIEAFQHSLDTRSLEIDNTRLIGLERLQELAGIDVPDIAGLAETTMPPVTADADHWIALGREHHPQLKALQYGVEAADNQLKAARAQHYPQLRLQVSQVYTDSGGFDNRQSEPYDIGTVGLQMNVPIYAGGGIDAGVREAIANRGLAETERLTRLREIEREIQAVFLRAQTERARINSLGQEVEARRKARDAQQKSYEIGVSTVVDVLEARKNLLRSQADQAAARYSYIRLLLALRLWTGTLTRAELETVNRWFSTQTAHRPGT